MFKILILGICLLVSVTIRADTPASCMYEDIKGKWTFYSGEGGHDNTIDCSKPFDVKTTLEVELKYPNIVVDWFGNEGTWTMIYNQGFEVVVHGRKFFAFSKYTQNGNQVTSICNETLPGWAHDVLERDWSCYHGVKNINKSKKLRFNVNGNSDPWIHTQELPVTNGDYDKQMYKTDEDLIEKINRNTNIFWYAKKYEQFEKMTISQMNRMMGGKKIEYPAPAPATEEVKMLSAALPEEFDWRNQSGMNFVTPVRNQGGCGSCYAFAACAMNEARLKVATKNTIDVALSPQDVLDCSSYSQGCDGGFPYLIGGKFAEDFGMVDESCNPYQAFSRSCNLKERNECTKYYFTKYEYIGGYYGACNEDLMKLALVKYGPIAVGFQVLDDFRGYHGGVYYHTGLKSKYNPFVETNHAVLVVGYGVEKETGMKFWIVKNSWGNTWGEKGYFRIRRGTNEVGIESLSVQTHPIF